LWLECGFGGLGFLFIVLFCWCGFVGVYVIGGCFAGVVMGVLFGGGVLLCFGLVLFFVFFWVFLFVSSVMVVWCLVLGGFSGRGLGVVGGVFWYFVFGGGGLLFFWFWGLFFIVVRMWSLFWSFGAVVVGVVVVFVGLVFCFCFSLF